MEMIRSHFHSNATIALLMLLALSGCATAPSLNTSTVNSTVVPNKANNDIDLFLNRTVHWGGQILEIKNLRDRTEVTVLGFPLDSDGTPNIDQKPIGRFILIKEGFLEPLDYHKDKIVSTVGSISGGRKGAVGESDYTYTLLNAQQIQLWPDPPTRTYGSHFSIGVGIGF